MKSRDSQMSGTGSTCVAETRAASMGAGTASRQARRGTQVRPTTPDSQGSASQVTTPLTHEQIANRAKALWLASGCLPGRDVQNWCEAEAQLKTELKSH